MLAMVWPAFDGDEQPCMLAIVWPAFFPDHQVKYNIMSHVSHCVACLGLILMNFMVITN